MKTIQESDSEFICHIEAPCFQLLQPSEVEFVRSSKVQVLFRKGDNLTKQNAFASYVLFIVNGIAKQYIEGNGNRSLNLRIIQPGEFVGLSTVFSKNTFSYSSVALTDCQAFLIEKSAIANVVEQNGLFGMNIIRRYCDQSTALFGTMETIAFKQMNGRMAQVLLNLEEIRKRNHDLFQLLSRKDLADFAGISTESTVKVLKSFEKDGLITLHDKDIHIVNIRMMEEIADRG